MRPPPAFSILFPVYNAESYLTEAVESILAQSVQGWELIAVNDGSKDASGAILESFAKRDRRIKCLHQENSGIVGALNAAIASASGRILVRADADDISVPHRLAALGDFLEKNSSVDLVGSGFGDPDGGSDWLPPFCESEEIKAGLIFGNWTFAHATAALRREVCEATQPLYNSEAKHIEDYDLWTRLTDRTFANMVDVLYLVRHHAESITRKHVELMHTNAERICAHMLQRLGIERPEVDWQAHRWLMRMERERNCSMHRLARWLDVIETANLRSGCFGEAAFERVIHKRLSAALHLQAGLLLSDFVQAPIFRRWLGPEWTWRTRLYGCMAWRQASTRLPPLKACNQARLRMNARRQMHLQKARQSISAPACVTFDEAGRICH